MSQVNFNVTKPNVIQTNWKDLYEVRVLNSVYDCASNLEVQKLFAQMIQFKINGYLKEYPYGVLPMDASDFIGTHLLLVRRSDEKIVMGMKTVTLEKCLTHQVRFPMLGMLESKDNTTLHQQAVKEVMDKFMEEGRATFLSYNGSYTVDPEVRANKELMKSIWEISQSIMVNFYLSNETTQVMAVCSRQFKIDRVKKNLGWDYFYKNVNDLSKPQEELGEYRCQALGDALFLPMTMRQHSDMAIELARKYHELWNERKEYGIRADAHLRTKVDA